MNIFFHCTQNLTGDLGLQGHIPITTTLSYHHNIDTAPAPWTLDWTL